MQEGLSTPEQQQRLLASLADNPPRIFYHHPCPDGVFAALAATLHFQAHGVTPRYVPHEVYRPLDLDQLQLQPDEAAYLLDYAGPAGFAQDLAACVAAVVVLDHHKTAAEQLWGAGGGGGGSSSGAPQQQQQQHAGVPANLHVLLDMGRSGAAIARDFFRPPGLSDALQDMFRWVEDADLWRWALPQSAAFHAGLADLKLEYSAGANPGIWQQLQQLDTQRVVQQGEAVIARRDALIAEALSGAQPYQLGGALGLTRGWGAALGCRVAGDLVLHRSKLGNALAEQGRARGLAPVGLVAYVEADMPNKATHVKVSLRSVAGFDTSAVTGALGGGGHAAASSCIVTLQELEEWRRMAA